MQYIHMSFQVLNCKTYDFSKNGMGGYGIFYDVIYVRSPVTYDFSVSRQHMQNRYENTMEFINVRGLGVEPPGKCWQNRGKLGVRLTPCFHHEGGVSWVGKYGNLSELSFSQIWNRKDFVEVCYCGSMLQPEKLNKKKG